MKNCKLCYDIKKELVRWKSWIYVKYVCIDFEREGGECRGRVEKNF